MKKMLLAVLLLVANQAHADSCATKLSAFVPGQQVQLCSSFGSNSNHNVIPSVTNTYTLGDALHNWANVFTRILTFGGTTSKIIPGSTSISLRNNADSADNLLVSDAGVVTVRSNLTPGTDNTADTGGSALAWRNVYANGLILNGTSPKIIPGSSFLQIRNHNNDQDNVVITDAGSVKLSQNQDLVLAGAPSTLALQESSAGAACSGTLTANGATPVVTSTTCAITGSRIFLSRTSAETGVVQAWKSALSTGVSFSVTGEAGDTGTYDWFIIHESP
jgi:hypothetical protein